VSHEIILLTQTPGQRAAVQAALVADRHWRRTDTVLAYENPDTGVYANVEGLDDPPHGDDGIVAVINYTRPPFFGLEVVPQLVAAAQAAEILVVDAQDDLIGGTGAPKPPVVDELVASWEAGNRAASAVRLRADPTAGVMPRDHAIAWWRYMRQKGGLTDRYGQTHYVPGLRLVRHSGSRDVLRLLSWTDWIPLILPEADLVAVIRSNGGTFEIRGLLPFGTIANTLEGLVGRVAASDDLEVRVLDPSEAVLVPELLDGATLEPFAGLEAVAVDAIVDGGTDGE
jgi:hypothetical protein